MKSGEKSRSGRSGGRFLVLAVPFLLLFGALRANAVLEAAHRAYQEGNYRKAEFLYLQALKSGENAPIIHYNLAGVKYRQGKVPEAIGYYEKVIEAAPFFKDSYLNLGKIYFQLEEYVQSLRTFESFLSVDPLDDEASLLVGDVQKRLGLLGEASGSYQRVIERNPSNAEAHLALSTLYQELGDLPKALRVIEIGLRNTGGDRTLRENQAMLLREAGRFRDSAAVYELLLGSSTNAGPDPRFNWAFAMADCYQQAGFANLAIQTLRALCLQRPDKENAIETLGFWYTSATRYDEAFSFYVDLFPLNRTQAYLGVKKVLGWAHNNGRKETVRKALDFYRTKGIRDELVAVVESKEGS